MTTCGPLLVDKNFNGTRLDVFLASWFAAAGMHGALSRTEIQRLLAEGQITLNGVTTKASTRIRTNDRIDVRYLPMRETNIAPEALPLDILYEDGDCLVINKEPGMVVHPAAGRNTGTLVNALLHHCKDLTGIGGERRPGIVHRLDKDTSGVMIIAKNMAAFHHLVAQFKNRQVRKEYLALAWGKLVPATGLIDRPIGRHRADRKRMSSLHALKNARPALTAWQVLESFAIDAQVGGGEVSFLRLLPHTGRTHQLRVHLADLGFPLIGDRVYGHKRLRAGRSLRIGSILGSFPRQALHAEKLEIEQMRTGKRVEFQAPLATDLQELLETLRPSSAAKGACGG